MIAAPIAPTPIRATPAAEDHREEVARADVEVLEHPVALAVVEDHPGEAADAGQDERPERAADHDERPVVGAGAAADHVEHDDEDQGRRQGLGDRVDEEQERVRPVRLHLPAEPDGGQEAPPDVDPAAAARPGVSNPPHSGEARPAASGRRAGSAAVIGRGRRVGRRPHGGPHVGAHCQRTDRRPSARASARGRGGSRRTGRGRRRPSPQDQRLDRGAGRPDRVGGVGEGELAHRVEADGKRQDADRDRAQDAEPGDREVQAGHEVDRLDEELGQVPRLAAPHQEQAGEHHPEPVQRRQRQQEHRRSGAPIDRSRTSRRRSSWR